MARVAFHPDLRAARWLPRSTVGPRSLRLLRRLGRRTPDAARHGGSVAEIGSGVTVRVFEPAPDGDPAPRPALLWIHGGGYVFGGAAQDDPFCREAADRLGATVAAVEYRLAPEHPYPTPLDDCATALRWLADRPVVDPRRVAVGGASAGGGLAAALALRAAREGSTALAFQLLVYPMIDDRTADRADVDGRLLRMWSPGSNRFAWRAYLGPRAGADVPDLAAPARALDLAGLPPTWIGVGTHDLFHDEDVTYARRLREAGVPCELEVVPGAYHGFDAVQRSAAVSRSFRSAQLAALAAGLAATGRGRSSP